jgi:chemotaxis-related protein WspB
MQAVLFHVGPERFAIDTRSVAEVIPGIPARPVPSAPAALRGVIEYRGAVVPVLDLCRLFGRGDCPARLGNRILVCDLEHAGRRWGAADAADSFLGVLAEGVTHVTTLDPDAPGSHPGPATEGIGGLGRILRDADGLVQLVEVRDLVPAEVLAAVRREAREEAE